MSKRIFGGACDNFKPFYCMDPVQLELCLLTGQKMTNFLTALKFYLSDLTVGTASHLFMINFNQILATGFGQLKGEGEGTENASSN